jgi:hypothetical protein
MSISGAKHEYDSYYIDGINVNDAMGGGPGSVSGGVLGVDAIQEFSVLTSNNPAQYGRTSGGMPNAISRSVPKDFHGAAYEFLRNDGPNGGDVTLPEEAEAVSWLVWHMRHV